MLIPTLIVRKLKLILTPAIPHTHSQSIDLSTRVRILFLSVHLRMKVGSNQGELFFALLDFLLERPLAVKCI